VRKKRQQFSKKLKQEIATAYAAGTITTQEIEAKGIRIGNVYRWMKKFGGDNPPQPAALSAPAEPSKSTTIVDIRTLSKKQLKRGSNGRYDTVVKESVIAALDTMSVSEVAAITKIQEATLYLWKTPKSRPKAPATSTAMVPVNGAAPTRDVVPMRKAELIFNPESTDVLLASIRKSEGFANLEKACKQLKAALRSGLIDDYDEIDLRVLLGHRQLTGGGLRQRR
jgi:transposase-like protein